MDHIAGTLSQTSGNIIGQLSVTSGQLSGALNSVSDHTKLTGRSEPDQHPISAITGLQAFTDALSDGFELYCGTSTEVI